MKQNISGSRNSKHRGLKKAELKMLPNWNCGVSENILSVYSRSTKNAQLAPSLNL